MDSHARDAMPGARRSLANKRDGFAYVSGNPLAGVNDGQVRTLDDAIKVISHDRLEVIQKFVPEAVREREPRRERGKERASLLGILVNPLRPSSFWPFMQKGQGSVETTCKSWVRSPRQRSACMCFGRRGGVQTYFAPSKSGRSRSSSERNRYCGQVSA